MRSLLLCGPGINPMRFEDPFVLAQHRAQAEAIAARDPAAYVEAFLRLAVDGPHRTPARTPAAVREACRTMATETVRRHHATAGVPLVRDAAARLEEIGVPTLLVAGELETADVLRVVGDAHRRIPSAQRVDLPATGHMTNLEQPAALDRLLLGHLARHA